MEVGFRIQANHASSLHTLGLKWIFAQNVKKYLTPVISVCNKRQFQKLVNGTDTKILHASDNLTYSELEKMEENQ